MNNENVELRQSIRRYFGQPGFARFFALLRKKYESSKSGPKGYIRLHGITEVEREALDGFYGTYTPIRMSDPDLPEQYSIRQFEKRLLASRFALTLAELLETLDGDSLLTRGQWQIAEEEAWQEMIRREAGEVRSELDNVDLEADADFDSSPNGLDFYRNRLAQWVESLGDGTSPGFRMLRKLFAAQRETARICLSDSVRALQAAIHRNRNLDDTDENTPMPLRLPILSARITGDAHALDWKYPLGRLFWWGLAAIFSAREGIDLSLVEDGIDEEDDPVDEYAIARQPEGPRGLSRALLIREGYRRGGIADDDLSSQVLFFAPGWYQSWEEKVLTLRQVEKLSKEELEKLRPSAVYAVENPSVFAVLVDEAARRFDGCSPGSDSHSPTLPLLLCGNGQPSVAVVKLLEWLLDPHSDSAPPFYYSGDLDVAGLEIANSLRQRFPGSFQAWKMDVDVLKRYANRGIRLSAAECERVVRQAPSWEDSLPQAVATMGIKLHQELWVDELAMDFLLAFE